MVRKLKLAVVAAVWAAGLIAAPTALAQAPQGHPFARVSLHDWENRTDGLSRYNFENGTERGSRYRLINGADGWSLYGMVNGTHPLSFHGFLNGTAPGSAYYWRNGDRSGSAYYWRNGTECLSQHQWLNATTTQRTCDPSGGVHLFVVLLCLADYIRIEPCEVWNAAALAERSEDVAAFRARAQGLLR
jgi:hypothetical protein